MQNKSSRKSKLYLSSWCYLFLVITHDILTVSFRIIFSGTIFIF